MIDQRTAGFHVATQQMRPRRPVAQVGLDGRPQHLERLFVEEYRHHAPLSHYRTTLMKKVGSLTS